MTLLWVFFWFKTLNFSFSDCITLGKELLGRSHYASNEIKEKLLELTNMRNEMLHRWEERWEHLQLILEVYQFARDAAVAEAWLMAQDPYLKSEELGVSLIFFCLKMYNTSLAFLKRPDFKIVIFERPIGVDLLCCLAGESQEEISNILEITFLRSRCFSYWKTLSILLQATQ